MTRFVGYFARGTLVLLPVAATAYILYFIVAGLDGLLGLPYPGLGLALAIVMIMAVGFLVSNVLGRQVYGWFDRLMARLPVAKLLYTSIRDLIQAFVSEERRFGRPVMVRLTPGSDVRVMGFVSRNGMHVLGLPDHVAVYVPQAYNIAGQVLLVPPSQVERLHVQPSDLLAFLLSGGASGLGATPPPPAVAEV